MQGHLTKFDGRKQIWMPPQYGDMLDQIESNLKNLK